MSKLGVFVIVFLLIGMYMIHTQTQYTDESFSKSVWEWFKQLGRNMFSVTGFAVKEHDWLPNQSEMKTDTFLGAGEEK